MSDGWESPDEAAVVTQRASSTFDQPKVYNSRYINRSNFRGRGQIYGKDENQHQRHHGNWRSNNDHTNQRQNWDLNKGRYEREGNSSWNNENNQPVDESWGDVASINSKPKFFNRRPKPNDPFVTMEVDSQMVGKIIGRGGSKITELQENSGAQIIVTKQEENGKVIVKLFGDDEVTTKARDLIEQLVKDRPHNRGFNDANSKNDIKIDEHAPFDWKALSEECDRATKERWAKCPTMIKNFYKEDPYIAQMSENEVEYIRTQNNNIVVSRVFADKKGYKPIPNPVCNFEQCFREYPEIMSEINRAGFEIPSPIQCQAWPVLLSGEDLIGIAQTGTGKTLAFLLPALIHIDGQPIDISEREGPNVLILAPTRELALQIEKEVKKYQYKDIKAVCLYGGGSRKEQVNIVTQGVQIVIATPGRLNDLVMAGYINVSSITYLVLDEADRMLDMGFEPQIRKVLLDIRPDRQTVMTSATWPPGVRRLAEFYMDNPVQVYVGTLDLTAVHSVTQTIHFMENDEDEKFNTFIQWIQTMQPDDKVIVFCGKKARADYISVELTTLGIECQSIHGDRDQSDREQALIDISDGSVRILIATDVASRGIDIQDITHVINYDFPRNIEEYVHRVGRTGRAGRSGESITYMTRADWTNARELISILEEANQYVPDELQAMAKRFEAMKERKQQERLSGGGGFRGRGGGRPRW